MKNLNIQVKKNLNKKIKLQMKIEKKKKELSKQSSSAWELCGQPRVDELKKQIIEVSKRIAADEGLILRTGI